MPRQVVAGGWRRYVGPGAASPRAPTAAPTRPPAVHAARGRRGFRVASHRGGRRQARAAVAAVTTGRRCHSISLPHRPTLACSPPRCTPHGRRRVPWRVPRQAGGSSSSTMDWPIPRRTRLCRTGGGGIEEADGWFVGPTTTGPDRWEGGGRVASATTAGGGRPDPPHQPRHHHRLARAGVLLPSVSSQRPDRRVGRRGRGGRLELPVTASATAALRPVARHVRTGGAGGGGGAVPSDGSGPAAAAR